VIYILCGMSAFLIPIITRVNLIKLTELERFGISSGISHTLWKILHYERDLLDMHCTNQLLQLKDCKVQAGCYFVYPWFELDT
jgi:hypothetical protein